MYYSKRLKEEKKQLLGPTARLGHTLRAQFLWIELEVWMTVLPAVLQGSPEPLLALTVIGRGKM